MTIKPVARHEGRVTFIPATSARRSSTAIGTSPPDVCSASDGALDMPLAPHVSSWNGAVVVRSDCVSSEVNQHETAAEMQPVDLDHQKVERGQIGSHEVGQPRRRQRYELRTAARPPTSTPPWAAAIRVRLRALILIVAPYPRSGRCRHITLGQPDSAAEPARRHIDQHQVHRPATEPVLLRRPFPSSGS